MILCHRFYSTGWWGHLGKHVSTDLTEETFDKVVTLKVRFRLWTFASTLI